MVGSTGAGSSPWKGRGQDGADARPSRDEDEDDVCSRDDQVVSRSGLARAREPDTRLASLQPEYAPSGSSRPPPPSLTTSELPPDLAASIIWSLCESTSGCGWLVGNWREKRR